MSLEALWASGGGLGGGGARPSDVATAAPNEDGLAVLSVSKRVAPGDAVSDSVPELSGALAAQVCAHAHVSPSAIHPWIGVMTRRSETPLLHHLSEPLLLPPPQSTYKPPEPSLVRSAPSADCTKDDDHLGGAQVTSHVERGGSAPRVLVLSLRSANQAKTKTTPLAVPGAVDAGGAGGGALTPEVSVAALCQQLLDQVRIPYP